MTNDTPDYDTASILVGGTALIDKEVSFIVEDPDSWRHDPALMRAYLEEAFSHLLESVEEFVLRGDAAPGGGYIVSVNAKVGRDVWELIRRNTKSEDSYAQ